MDLAIELKKAGHHITATLAGLSGSDRDKLLNDNAISEIIAPEKIVDSEVVVIGPAATTSNPEVTLALERGLPVYSLPDFIYQSSIDKQRLVVTGNHGKTFITALIIHVLLFNKRKFDYYTAGKPSGFSSAVKLSDAPIIIIEGQDVSSSNLDPSPAFLKYHHHIGVINGIEWQASSLYPTRDEYVRQFQLFGASSPKGGMLVYFEMDPVVTALPIMNKPDVLFIAYKTHPSVVDNGREYLVTPEKDRVPVKVTGKHNMQNISAAQETLKRIGITNEMFYRAIPSFEIGAH